MLGRPHVSKHYVMHLLAPAGITSGSPGTALGDTALYLGSELSDESIYEDERSEYGVHVRGGFLTVSR